MNKQYCRFLVLVLSILIISGCQLFRQPDGTKLSYSTFLLQLEEQNVQEVTIQGEKIIGLLKTPAVKQLGEGRQQEYTKFHTFVPAIGDKGLMTRLMQNEVEVNTRPEHKDSLVRWLVVLAPFLVLIVIWQIQYRRLQGQSGERSSIGRNQARKYEKSQESTTFTDVAGAQGAKTELQELVSFLNNPEEIRQLGGEVPKGVMLVGPPGTGKTLLARAVSGEAGVPFFLITGSDFMEMFVGVGAKRVRNLFADAKKSAPCIIFIDEIDAIGRRRGAGLGGGHDEREQTLNQLLSELDGFEKNEDIIVMTATNRPDILDPALMRPGRFDRKIIVDLPNTKERKEILVNHSQNKSLSNDVDLESLARSTPGFSGADLENMLNEAALLSSRKGRQDLDKETIDEARDKILMGLERKGLALTEEEKEILAYHEAGHAIVGALLPNAEPVHKVSIVPRTRTMGATQQFPEKERYIFTKEYLLDRLAMMMGGRAAESLIFNTSTSGAGNDLQEATKMARKMVLQWGMSGRFEHMAYAEQRERVFIGEELGKTREYSEITAQAVDNEVESLLNDSFGRAMDLLKGHQGQLDDLAKLLIKNEEVFGQEVKGLIEDKD